MLEEKRAPLIIPMITGLLRALPLFLLHATLLIQ